MIRLINSLPDILDCDVSLIKIRLAFESYPEDTLLWEQDGGRCLLCMSGRVLIIYDRFADFKELSEFIGVISPDCVFADYRTLKRLNLKITERINVMRLERLPECALQDNDMLKSDEIYELLNVKELTLPPFESFAVDFCRRLNHGRLKYFAKRDTCAAVLQLTDGFALLTGIVSSKKGGGTLALCGVLEQCPDYDVLACCRDDVIGFYEKNGFVKTGVAGMGILNH